MNMHKFVLSMFLSLLMSGTALAGHTILSVSAHAPSKDAETDSVTGFFLKFDISGVPEDVRIDAALLEVTVSTAIDSGATLTLCVEPAMSSWSASDVAISDGSVDIMPDSLTGTFFVRSGEGKPTRLNVTEMVRQWYSEELDNEGLIVRLVGMPDTPISLDSEGAQIMATLTVFHSK